MAVPRLRSLGKLQRTCVSRLSREGHKVVFIQLLCLVIFGFEDGGASHGSFGGRQNDEVLSSDAE